MLLVARRFSTQAFKDFRQPKLQQLLAKINENNISSKYEEALKRFEGRIWFNSVLEIQSVRLKEYDRIIGRKEEKKKAIAAVNIKPLPLVLSQLCEGAITAVDQQDDDFDSDDEASPDSHNLPYARFLKVAKDEEVKVAEEVKVPKNWMQDYELYDESEQEIQSIYGTPNSSIPVSNVPCNGCGAHLHCKDASIPGYVPSELFKGLKHAELTTIHCQRCHFLINYNTAINVTVAPEDYINIISTIKDKYALTVIMVDLLDFPCSIFSGIKDILGSKRSIFIVGNKVDLLPQDQPDFLNHIKRCLKTEAMKMGFEERFIKHISLISAKTGYGIEELITKLYSVWQTKGDVYLIGCTNVGKSSLFNALLKSDYCKVEASNLVQRATTCPWPGTTLRMLKFPILRPSDFKIHLRTERLVTQQRSKYEEHKLRRDQAKATKDPEHATLIGHIGRTFEKEDELIGDPASSSHDGGFGGKIFTLNENSDKYKQSKWCFDTPGVIQRDQILHLLTTDEIIKTVPKEMIRPRVFLIKPNLSLFLAGLGRLDYIEGPRSIRVIVYSSLNLPVSIVETKDADDFYESFLGSEILGVPMDSGKERLATWPRLEAEHDQIVVEGNQKHITACDILLSSAGWVGINLPGGFTGTFKAWTPEKRGIYVRSPSLHPHGMALRGKRVRRSLAYLIGNAFTYRKPIK